MKTIKIIIAIASAMFLIASPVNAMSFKTPTIPEVKAEVKKIPCEKGSKSCKNKKKSEDALSDLEDAQEVYDEVKEFTKNDKKSKNDVKKKADAQKKKEQKKAEDAIKKIW